MKYRFMHPRLAVLLLIVAFALAGCAQQDLPLATSDPFQDTDELTVPDVSQGVLDALSQACDCLQEGTLHLKIYYISHYTLFRYPLSTEKLISSAIAEVIVVENDELQKHAELLGLLFESTLIPVEDKSYENVRLCYVFEVPEEGAILTVASNLGNSKTCFINGLEVQYDVAFYDVIRPFLTEEITNELDPIYK